MPAISETIANLQKNITDFDPKRMEITETPDRVTGQVESYGDGMAVVTMQGVKTGKIVHFDGGSMGIVSGLFRENSETKAHVLLLDTDHIIRPRENIYSDNKEFSVPGGWEVAGRVLSGVGIPLDGGKSLEDAPRFPIERPSAPFYERQNVDTPMETGYLAVDALIPVGRGQRELIIGDRHTGKTALAVDIIKNQKDRNVLCIYVAVGKKRQDTLRTIDSLKQSGAMDYTVVIMSPGDDSPAMQLYAPLCGCAIGESVMNNGGDALIIYDDLTAHAWAYRQSCLMQRRPVGREAYPGDVFSLHARLLERAARLSDTLHIVNKDTHVPIDGVFTGHTNMHHASAALNSLPDKEKYEIKVAKKGGSLTAFPILETQQGDFSAFVTTNVVSITDGQLYLDSSLFRSNKRPAVHVGLSVSRVGGDAQPPSIKQLAGGLREDLASLNDLAAASLLGRSSLDTYTQQLLNHGEHLQRLIIQDEGKPWSVAEQVVLLFGGTHKTVNFDKIPLEQLDEFTHGYLQHLDVHKAQLMKELNTGIKLNDGQKEQLENTLSEYLKSI